MPRFRAISTSLVVSRLNRTRPSTSLGATPASSSAARIASSAMVRSGRPMSFANSVWPMPMMAVARRMWIRCSLALGQVLLATRWGCIGPARRSTLDEGARPLHGVGIVACKARHDFEAALERIVQSMVQAVPDHRAAVKDRRGGVGHDRLCQRVGAGKEILRRDDFAHQADLERALRRNALGLAEEHKAQDGFQGNPAREPKGALDRDLPGTCARVGETRGLRTQHEVAVRHEGEPTARAYP